MKVIQVQTQAEAAGAQYISDALGKGLRARGHDVRTVFLYRKTAAFDEDPFADFLLKSPPRSVIEQLLAVVRLIPYLRRQKADVVITFQHFGNVFGAIAARLCGCRTVIANQSGAPGWAGVARWVEGADRLLGTVGAYSVNIVNSRWTQSAFDDFPAGYRRRLCLIPHGVESSSGSISKADARRKFGLPLEGTLMLTAGRLAYQKNHLALIEPLRRLPYLSLAIAGAGPLEGEVRQAAARAGVSSRLFLLGEVAREEMSTFLSSGDVFVFPSLYETFGLAVVEAAIAGLPIVCSDLDVLREVLSDDDGRSTATFVDFSAPADVTIAISNAVSSSAENSQLRIYIAERYSMNKMVSGYQDLFPSNSV